MAYEVVSTGKYQFPIGKGKTEDNYQHFVKLQIMYQFPIGKGKAEMIKKIKDGEWDGMYQFPIGKGKLAEAFNIKLELYCINSQ